MQSRPRFLAPGDKLGKYDLIRQIAIGGMAELYLARTVGIEGFEKLVVVKRILPQYMANQQFVGMFLNEARLAATLQHPNIAQVYDIGVEEGDYFFSMEYIHGEDLGRLIATATEHGVPLSLDTALTLGAGLCAGLHYAHDKTDGDGKPLGVVHRDVSPSNVLVSYDGGVKLVDFGIARASSHNTTQGGLKGKIAYMSPEQCRGKAVLDRRSDVFSVGSILFELTTGRPPFVDETEYGILNQIVNTDAPRPSSIVPTYHPALETIVMRALARDPDARYATALELQGDLEDFAHENRVRVSPLVLARLMSSLFPARLEEWEHAKKQGAFFVEQHVVKTMIESKRSDADGPTGSAAPFAPDMEPTGVDTQITTMPVPPDDTGTRVPLAAPPAPDESVPVQAPHVQRFATGPVAPRTPMPGAVPIIAAFTAPIPAGAPVHPAVLVVPDRTEHVRVPTPAPIARSRGKIIAIATIATLAVAGVVFFVTRDSKSAPAAVGDTNSSGDSNAKPGDTSDSSAKSDDPNAAKSGDANAAKSGDANATGAAKPDDASASKAAKADATSTTDATATKTDAPATKTDAKTTKTTDTKSAATDASTKTDAKTTKTTDATKTDAKTTTTTETKSAATDATSTKTDAKAMTTDTKTATTDATTKRGTTTKKTTTVSKKTPPKTTEKKGSAWSNDSIFMPVRPPEKH